MFTGYWAMRNDMAQHLVKAPMKVQAVHASQEDLHAVTIGSLRVLVCEEAGEWFAQGVEIDYAATGASPEEVKTRFERGLAATVHLHLRSFGSVERLLKFAPESVWQKLKSSDAYDFSMVTVHNLANDLGKDAAKLPFDRLVYLPQDNTHRAAYA
jgi:hypothetical protein